MSGPPSKDILHVEDQYYILANSAFADDRTRVLKHGETFAVFDRYGDVLPVGLGEQGLFHQGTRFLCKYLLFLGSRRPLLLGSTVLETNDALSVDLTNPDLRAEGGHVTSIQQEAADSKLVPHGALHLSRSRFLWRGAAFERLEITNHESAEVVSDLRFEFDADYADIFEVRGMKRERRGRRLDAVVREDRVSLGYEGLDGTVRRTDLEFSMQPKQIDASSATFALRLAPGERACLEISIRCSVGGESHAIIGHREAEAAASREMSKRQHRMCQVTTSNEQFNAWLSRSVADLIMLVTETGNGPYPYAGVPWYSTVFGRDGLITAMELLWSHPQLAAGVLSHLAATQADCIDLPCDAEPGKILHESRLGEMAALGEIPFGSYYGTIDATPLFVMLAGQYHLRTGDDAMLHRLWPKLDSALEWIDRYGDRDGDGFVEYERSTERGLMNQGWKDSWDSVSHADGTLADAPIALCEVQGYVYAAYLEGARLAGILGHEDRSAKLARQASELRARFDEHFWDEGLGCYALALDGDNRPCRVVSSNAGHCLFTGIARPERARRLATTLLSDSMFSGWGVRTLAAGERRYNPMSYHNGSIWPHDSALIAAGLSRYDCVDEAARIASSLFSASLFVDLHRLPELYCGFERREAAGPVLYPVACAPQAWAAGASFLVLRAMLGLRIDGAARRVCFDRPVLPEYLSWVRLDGLDVGGASVDLLLERHPGDVSVRVLERDAPVEIVVVK